MKAFIRFTENLSMRNRIIFSLFPLALALSFAIFLVAYQGLSRTEHASTGLDSILASGWFLAAAISGQVVLIGQAVWLLLKMTRKLEGLAQELDEGASQLTRSVNEISDSSTALSSGVTQQAAALQQTVASLDEVRAMVGKNAENADRTKNLTESTSKDAVHGQVVIKEMVSAIEEIRSSTDSMQREVDTSNQHLSEILKVISEIGGKTKIINDIVFQTRLLSFNASVEAARAGEHGKGFAVVAEEVGNLAQVSGAAAKEIAQMLEGSIQKVESIIGDTKSRVGTLVISTNEKVESGTVAAKKCDEVFALIIRGVEEMNQMIVEIATASQEQSQGVNEISKAMNQFERVNQQHSSAAGLSAYSAGSLSEQARALKERATSLRVLLSGRVGGGSEPKGTKAPELKPSLASAPSAKVIAMPKKAAKDGAPSAENPPSEDDPRFQAM